MIRLIPVLFFFLSACDTLMTRENIRQSEGRDFGGERIQGSTKSSAVTIAPIDTNNRFSEIEADLRQMNGRIEIVENRLGQASAEKDSYKKNSDEQVADLQKKFLILQEEMSKLNDAMMLLSSQVSQQAKASPAAADTKLSLFEEAQSYFEKKEFKKAILSFQKFKDANPKDKRIAEATYKIAVSFQELGMKDESIPFYDEVISKYPNSVEAKKSKIRLKKIK